MLSHEERERTWLERVLVAASVAAAASIAFAFLEVRRDGWLAWRLRGVAWNSLARHLDGARPLVALAALVALATVVHPLFSRIGRGSPGRKAWLERAWVVLLAAAGWFVATGRFAPTAATPALRGTAGIVGNAAFAVAALVVAVLATALARRVRRRSRLMPRFARAAGAIALVVAAAPLALGLASRATIVTLRGDRTSVVLISVDTLRADRLGCQGHSRDTTPVLDALARDAVRFANASSPYPFTLTAHASMFTGLDPAANGAIKAGPRVDDRLAPFADVATIAQAFRDAGYVAAAVVDDCLWMQPAYGLARGFDNWRVVGGSLDDKTRVLDELVRDLAGRACFLFLHCFDVHSDHRRLPYECASEDRGRYSGWYGGAFDGADPGDPKSRASELLRRWNQTRATVDEEVVRYVSDLYDEGVRTADRKLGVALAALDRAGFRERAALLVTADHGEEFREHGLFMHDAQLYDESVRVPLLLRLPRGAHAGEVVTTPVALQDVAPTLAAIAGVPFSSRQGRSLLGLIGAEDVQDVEVVPVFLGADANAEGVRLGRFKLVRHGERVELFDLEADPGERKDLAGERPEVARTLEALLEQRAAENRAFAAERARDGSIALTEAERKRIGAIGY